MTDQRPKLRVVGLYAPRRALARGVAPALERLGYRLAPSDRGRESELPDARIAAERELRRVPRGDRAPLILLEGRFSKRLERPRDPRLVATLRKPAALADLYRALQLALEENPRTVPRASLTLPARCVSGEHDFAGAIVSLSEGGCLVRSARAPESRRRLRLWFPLPAAGLVEVSARPLYRRDSHLGLAFHELADATRRAIAGCVENALIGRG
jgi:PilZ domain